MRYSQDQDADSAIQAMNNIEYGLAYIVVLICTLSLHTSDLMAVPSASIRRPSVAPVEEEVAAAASVAVEAITLEVEEATAVGEADIVSVGPDRM